MSHVNVKHVQSDQELQDAFKVRRKVFVEEQNVPEELEIDEYEELSEHFVAYNPELQPVGAGRLRELSSSTAKVERICVDSSYRGHGVGNLIMQKIEQIAKQKGYTTLYLNAQDHAETFYLKLGYTTVSDPFEEAGIMHIKMQKLLP